MSNHCSHNANDGVVSTYHQYLASMDCLSSGEAKRKWRKAIKDAWDNRCCFCGNPPISDASLTIDHIRPRSRGGEDVSSNCMPACLQHNQSKASSEWRSWFRSQRFYDQIREARIDFWLKHSRLPGPDELEQALKKLPPLT
jgi:hypothetical protein